MVCCPKAKGRTGAARQGRRWKDEYTAQRRENGLGWSSLAELGRAWLREERLVMLPKGEKFGMAR
ncbi:hypothetical protein MUP59_06840 [Candidatus Bathyarchaeota archaeon]|nr:hypothetical protein [Candidatus Bathyarchaeota archaeon]